MATQKQARRRCCRGCRSVMWRSPRFSGPHGYSRFCTAGDGRRIELHDAYMEGPDSNCPRGKWAGLEPDGPLDPEEWDRWNRERNRQQRRQKQKPKLRRAVVRIGKSQDIAADRRTALAVLVAAGKVPAWLAEELDEELNG